MIKKLFIIAALGLYCRASSAMENTKVHEEDSVKQCKEVLEDIIEHLEIREELQQEAKARRARNKEESLYFLLWHGNFQRFNALLKEGVSTESLIKEALNFWTGWKNEGGDYVKQLKILLDLGADPNKKSSHSKETPLWEAISMGNFNAVKVLLANPKTHITDDPKNDITLMMHAAKQCYHGGHYYTAQEQECSHKKVVKLLLFLGCDATRTRWSGHGAVYDALNHSRPDIADIIADYRHIDKHCSQEELQEFDAIKARRKATHAAIMRRQITGTFGPAPKLNLAKKDTASAPAKASSFAKATVDKTSDKTAAAGTAAAPAETSKK